jgi:hypothetical protein
MGGCLGGPNWFSFAGMTVYHRFLRGETRLQVKMIEDLEMGGSITVFNNLSKRSTWRFEKRVTVRKTYSMILLNGESDLVFIIEDLDGITLIRISANY